MAKKRPRRRSGSRRKARVGLAPLLFLTVGLAALALLIYYALGLYVSKEARQKGAHVKPAPTKPVASLPAAAPPPSPSPTPKKKEKLGHGWLAIMLDDAGHDLSVVEDLKGVPKEVAVAVLPFLPRSVDVATAIWKSGREVWLHLPMEPERYPEVNPGPGAILVSMSEQEVRSTVRAALSSIPFVAGVNNHEGSRATTNLMLMTWVMQELKARNLCFVDSRTTSKSVAEEAARLQGVPVLRRDVFLDNEDSEHEVASRVREAVLLARKRGWALAIGHCRPATMRWLARHLRGIQGITLIPPSDLVWRMWRRGHHDR